jgi:hypothetical protein
MSNEKNNNSLGVLEQLDIEANEQAAAPLETIADCYFALDVSEKAPFAEIQRAYRHKLYEYNLDRVEQGPEKYVFHSKMLPKVKEAYLRICKLLQRDPEQGLVETKDSLIRERDELLEGWKGDRCGTPAVRITQEHEERIDTLIRQPHQGFEVIVESWAFINYLDYALIGSLIF